MENKTVTVAVTGAAGQIGYALLFQIASGAMFGAEADIHLNLIELPDGMERLKGVVMELDDCAFPLLKSVVATDDLSVGFQDADWALLVGSVPRKIGMERSDLLQINGAIFKTQGQALSDFAKPACKVLVVGNPCNTNAYIAKKYAKNLDGKNFFALMMLDQNRAVCQLAQKAEVSVGAVNNMIVWGNHSATQFPDIYHATLNGIAAVDVIHDSDWIEKSFYQTVQKRGAAIIAARGLSSAASAAKAVVDTVRNIALPDNETVFSVAVESDGSYGIEKGIMFGFPVIAQDDGWRIVDGIVHGETAAEKIRITTNELLKEKELVDREQ